MWVYKNITSRRHQTVCVCVRGWCMIITMLEDDDRVADDDVEDDDAKDDDVQDDDVED